MATHGLIAWKKIAKMLNECARGWREEAKIHKKWIYFGNFEPFKLPLGEHGKRDNPDIQVGHVRGLVRHFDIAECAEGELEQLR